MDEPFRWPSRAARPKRRRGTCLGTLVLIILLAILVNVAWNQISSVWTQMGAASIIDRPFSTSLPLDKTACYIANAGKPGKILLTPHEGHNGYATDAAAAPEGEQPWSICATWQTPSITCGKTPPLETVVGIWIGLQTASGQLIQTGEVFDCSSRVWRYFHEVADNQNVVFWPKPHPVSGQEVTAWVSYAHGLYHLEINGLKDEVSGASGPPVTGEVAVEAPYITVNAKDEHYVGWAFLPNFGTVTFRNCSVNRTALFGWSSLVWYQQQYTVQNTQSGKSIVYGRTAEKITSPSSFEVTFLHS